METDLKIGDIVKLKGQEPKLTITCIDVVNNKHKITAVYFSKDKDAFIHLQAEANAFEKITD